LSPVQAVCRASKLQPSVFGQAPGFPEASGSNLLVAIEQAHSSVALPVDWWTLAVIRPGTMQ